MAVKRAFLVISNSAQPEVLDYEGEHVGTLNPQTAYHEHPSAVTALKLLEEKGYQITDRKDAQYGSVQSLLWLEAKTEDSVA
jgi:hypothetical protein